MRFVYAHNHHRRNVENSRNFRENMKERIRFVTATTPAYAHAYQSICLTRHLPANLCQYFRLLKTHGQVSLPSQCSLRNT